MATRKRRNHQCGRDHARHPRRIERIAAVVPAYLSEITIGATLQALLSPASPRLVGVFVVASPGDRSAEIATRYSSAVSVLRPPRRMSAGAARNLGAAEAARRGCDAVLFVDADCRIAPDCLERLAQALERSVAVAVAAAVVRDGNGTVARLRHALEFKESDGSAPPGPVVFVPSATFICLGSAFERVGGFPDMWPGEDLVFCHALLKRFGRAAITRAPGAKSFHRHPHGWWNMAVHQYRLGRTSALARRRACIHGSSWARTPLAAPVLALGRIVRAVVWFARYKKDELVWLIAVLPVYAALVSIWAMGFAAGCGGSLAPHRALGVDSPVDSGRRAA